LECFLVDGSLMMFTFLQKYHQPTKKSCNSEGRNSGLIAQEVFNFDCLFSR
jgi:hypothetical protein